MMTSSADFLGNFGCGSTGMPRPLSSTLSQPLSSSETSMKVAWPATASSMALSITSAKRWCKRVGVGSADIHAGAAAHWLEPLQHLDRGGGIVGFARRSSRSARRLGFYPDGFSALGRTRRRKDHSCRFTTSRFVRRTIAWRLRQNEKRTRKNWLAGAMTATGALQLENIDEAWALESGQQRPRRRGDVPDGASAPRPQGNVSMPALARRLQSA